LLSLGSVSCQNFNLRQSTCRRSISSAGVKACYRKSFQNLRKGILKQKQKEKKFLKRPRRRKDSQPEAEKVSFLSGKGVQGPEGEGEG
jgi:hypothetical protein